MTWRQQKQLLYGVILITPVVLAVALIVWWVVNFFRAELACVNQKQDFGETGVDCGGRCLPCELKNLSLVVSQPRFILYSDGTMDLIAEVENKSLIYGLPKFNYKFVIRGLRPEKDIAEVNGQSFILPAERKYIVVVNQRQPQFDVSAIEFVPNVSQRDWQKLDQRDVDVSLLNSAVTPEAVEAEIINSGNQTYQTVTLNFLVVDQNETLIALAQSTIEQLAPLERRKIFLPLPPVSAIPTKVIFQPEVNLYSQ